MPVVESFQVDHTKMNAPQVRHAKTIKGEKGDIVEVYDLRFKKPNTTYMSKEGVHSLEHLLATIMREKLDKLIDVSPMGCSTGFYMSIFNEHKKEEIEDALLYTLNKILSATEVPGASIKECGNYKRHSLEDAKDIAYEVLKGFENQK